MRRVPTDPSSTDPARQQQSRRAGIAYGAATQAVVAFLMMVGAGYWLDGRFDTSPIFLFLGTALGFGSFVLRLFRLGRQLQQLEAEERDLQEPPRP